MGGHDFDTNAVNRRRFFRLGALASAGLLAAPAGTLARPRLRHDPLPLGIASGDPTRTVSYWQNGLYSAYRNLAREDLDLVVHLGDYIYEGGIDPLAPRQRQHDGPEVTSLESYRNRHALYRSDPHLQAAHAAFPWLVVPDDHEVENNYAGAISEDNLDRTLFLPRRARAFQAYYEQMPLRLGSLPVGPDIQLYRSVTFGNLVEFNALDTRQYRSDQPCNDGLQLRCPGALSPAQTMTGPTQEQCLLSRLDRSQARWNVLAQQTMFAQFDFLAGTRQSFNMDQWDGYVAARNRISSFLAQRQPSNPIVITGDIHSSWVHNIKSNFDDAVSATSERSSSARRSRPISPPQPCPSSPPR
jgi:alkaline phosphatase D